MQLLIIALLFAWASPAQAASQDNSSFYGKKLESLKIEGLKRTLPFVVTREIEIKKGQAISAEKLEESIQRIWNLDIFSQVKVQLLPGKDGQNAQMLIQVVEKWTTIPIFDFGASGTSKFITLGVADPNVFGRYLTFGIQYTQFEGRHSGAFWLSDPRFFDQRLQFASVLSYINRRRSLYTPDRQVQGGFTQRGPRISLSIEKEVHRYLRWGLATTLTDARFSESGLSASQLAANASNGISIPADDFNVTLSASLTLGRLDLANYLIQSGSSTLTLERADDLWASDSSFTRISLRNRYFWLFGRKLNLGWRFDTGLQSSDLLQHQFYLGGLYDVRGFLDGQFRGKAFWRTNLELRYLLMEKDWVVLQPVIFADAGRVGEKFSELISSQQSVFTSIGAGFRVICPKIYTCIGRLDFAQGFGSGGEQQVSIGVGQFF